MSKFAKIGQKIGNYRLIEQVGRGGMAEVFRAENEKPGPVPQVVAVKRLFSKLAGDRDFVQMFVNEARIASTLQHPNLVRTYDLINSGGTYFIVMEYLKGCDLEDLVARAQPGRLCMSMPEILHVVAEAARGLDYAHSGGEKPEDGPVVHRDISPGNILLDLDGRVKITDFGIARASHLSRQTQPGILKGKYEFMAPEYVARGECKGSSDLFSLGVVLYELLTGENPFADVLPRDTWKNIVEKEPLSPSWKVDGVPPAVDELVAWMLKKDPAERCPSGAEVVAAILGLEEYADPDAAARALGQRVRSQLEPSEAPSLSEFLPPEEQGELVDATQDIRTDELLDLLPEPGKGASPALRSMPIESMAGEATTPSIRRPADQAVVPARRKWPWILVALVLFLGSGSLVAFLLWPAESGKLTVLSDRRAEVYVDDKPMGLAPVKELPLSVGSHIIEVKRPGSQKVKRYERDVGTEEHLTLNVKWASVKKPKKTKRKRRSWKKRRKPRKKTRKKTVAKKKPTAKRKKKTVSKKKKTVAKKKKKTVAKKKRRKTSKRKKKTRSRKKSRRKTRRRKK